MPFISTSTPSTDDDDCRSGLLSIMQSVPRRGRSKAVRRLCRQILYSFSQKFPNNQGHYVCAKHDDDSNAGETVDRTSQSMSPSVSLPTTRKALVRRPWHRILQSFQKILPKNRSESVVYYPSPSMGPLVSLPTSRKAPVRRPCRRIP